MPEQKHNEEVNIELSKKYESWIIQAEEFQKHMEERGKFSEDVFERLSLLKDNNLFLEYIAIGAQVVEEGIRELIEIYVLAINFVLNQEHDLRDIKHVEPNFKEKDTLGSLILRLEYFCKNMELLENLKSLNTLRINVVHKLHTRKESLIDINESFRKDVEGNLIGTINMQILEQGSALSKSLSDILSKRMSV